jgi:hypothetical protein
MNLDFIDFILLIYIHERDLYGLTYTAIYSLYVNCIFIYKIYHLKYNLFNLVMYSYVCVPYVYIFI